MGGNKPQYPSHGNLPPSVFDQTIIGPRASNNYYYNSFHPSNAFMNVAGVGPPSFPGWQQFTRPAGYHNQPGNYIHNPLVSMFSDTYPPPRVPAYEMHSPMFSSPNAYNNVPITGTTPQSFNSSQPVHQFPIRPRPLRWIPDLEEYVHEDVEGMEVGGHGTNGEFDNYIPPRDSTDHSTNTIELKKVHEHPDSDDSDEEYTHVSKRSKTSVNMGSMLEPVEFPSTMSSSSVDYEIIIDGQ